MKIKNVLRCKGNRQKGLWLLAKSADTYAKYMKEDYENEERYIAALSDENKEWLNTFLQAYYHQSKAAMDKLNFPIMLRRERYNQHRGVKNDIYNKSNRCMVTHSSGESPSECINFENIIGAENGDPQNELRTNSLLRRKTRVGS